MSILVCIVEDDAALLASMCFSLQAQGFDARCFATANEMLDHELLSAKIDCLVIDQILPDIPGLDLLETLRKQGQSAPAILITTNPKDSDRVRAETLGAVVVEKPLLGDALDVAISSVLDEKQPDNA